MIGDAEVFPFQKVKMTKRPAVELFPIVKVESYRHGKVESTHWLVRNPDGSEANFGTYGEAEEYQQEHKKK